jgi:hypothetical protein
MIFESTEEHADFTKTFEWMVATMKWKFREENNTPSDIPFEEDVGYSEDLKKAIAILDKLKCPQEEHG